MPNTLNYFKEITKYPRPSKQEEKIRNFLIDFFSGKGYNYKVDTTGNLIVYIPAKNSQSQETIILQAHMDMVCVKAEGVNHDFYNDSLEIREENGFIHTNGKTTLGADNGIGIALCMSAIDFPSHPALELVFTIDEEAGMSGVKGLNFSLLEGKKIINLDSGDENAICIGSAGGVRISGSKKPEFTTSKKEQYNLEIFGMQGGHSGLEINKNRGNAIIIALDFIANYEKEIEMCNINAGTAENVIPSKIQISLGIDDIHNFEEKLKRYLENIKTLFDCPSIDFTIQKSENEKNAIRNAQKIIQSLLQIKDGIYTMSKKIPGLVQTSLNLGVIKIQNGILELCYLARSNDNEELQNLQENIIHILGQGNFEIQADTGYPAWQEDINSELLQIAERNFEKILGHKVKIVTHHAGLECGFFVKGLNNGANAISIGPNMYNIHSVDEKIQIDSIARVEKILTGILKDL
ncbi:aminoacyl-histidine dipeptidase [Candidatus Gracilibacteria bacterium]|nr:aminoacyl-histidine dipeptidase [Candidatus Gracilibacteria bacterium]NUJ98512.1 aminoacyl-histidine dipeptidase [Candidatus Gracilibacteria bacterium]